MKENEARRQSVSYGWVVMCKQDRWWFCAGRYWFGGQDVDPRFRGYKTAVFATRAAAALAAKELRQRGQKAKVAKVKVIVELVEYEIPST